MSKDLIDIVAKCDCCGKAYLVDLEGDDKTCDYCLAENELLERENESRLD